MLAPGCVRDWLGGLVSGRFVLTVTGSVRFAAELGVTLIRVLPLPSDVISPIRSVTVSAVAGVGSLNPSVASAVIEPKPFCTLSPTSPPNMSVASMSGADSVAWPVSVVFSRNT